MVSTAFATAPSPTRSDPQATDPTLVWQRVLSLLKLNTGEAHFDTYLRGTRGLVFDPGSSVIRVAAANPFHVPWLEGKLSSSIHTAVAETVGGPVRVEFITDAAAPPDGHPQRRQRPAPLLAALDMPAPPVDDSATRPRQEFQTPVGTRRRAANASGSGSPPPRRVRSPPLVAGP